jgi:ribosomal-protein-alanine N-acetyltransferase
MIAENINADRLVLSILDASGVGDRYLSWMTNPLVVRYLESRFEAPTISGLGDFVEQMRKSKDSYFFGIFVANEHVGNIKLGPVNLHHSRASMGVIIGEESAWGKGIATAAIQALTNWAFDTLGLHKITAGSYAENLGSIRAFEKAGYEIEGRLRNEVVLVDGTRSDTILLGKSRVR